MSNDLFDIFGVDIDDLRWQDLSICQGLETNDFFDNYESNDEVAKVMDEVCLSCPVMKQCMSFAIDNGEEGVWGGVYLTAGGKPDKAKNSHKTPEVWKRIKDRLS